MQVGDLVRAKHWKNGEIAILLSFQGSWRQTCRVAIGDYVFEFVWVDLEVVSSCK